MESSGDVQAFQYVNIQRTVYKDRNRELLMIYKHKISKALAIDMMKDTYCDEKTVGISDSYCDIDMINLCDIKVAMLNSDDQLKAACTHITKYDNNHGGAIKFLDDISHLK